MAQRPWIKHAESETFLHTQKDDYETFAVREQIDAQRYLGVDDFSDTDENDADDLLNTIR
jgi:hypothetical protein